MAAVVASPRSPALRPFVSSLGFFEGELPSGRERVLPTGHVSLMVNLHEDELRTYHGPGFGSVRRTRGTALSGPHAHHTVIDTQEQRCILWLSFRYGGAAPFFRTPLAETRDELVELEDLWGRDGTVLRERVLEAASVEERFRVLEDALLGHIAGERDAAVAAALLALDRGMPVAELSVRLGFSARQLLRRFRAATGLTPKRFARIRRLQRVVREAASNGSAEWVQVAAEHGYYDQSHLVHDFGELAGITPTAYRPRAASEWNHVPVG